jgi:hypothetical protein
MLFRTSSLWCKIWNKILPNILRPWHSIWHLNFVSCINFKGKNGFKITKNVFRKRFSHFQICLSGCILNSDHHYEISPSLSLHPTHSPSPLFTSLTMCKPCKWVCVWVLVCCLFAVFESSETRWTGCRKDVKSLHSLTTFHSRCLSLTRSARVRWLHAQLPNRFFVFSLTSHFILLAL